MIYCVEDDNSIREMTLYTLRASGFEAQGFSNAADFLAALEIEKPELILLDIMLPDQDGLSILKQLRGRSLTADIPVIMATAKGTEYDKVIGLDYGADDYLVKPFGMMEMVSRIRAVLRRYAGSENKDLLQAGALVLNKAEHAVTAGGKYIELTLKEFDLLRVFMEHPGKAFTRDELLAIVWKSDYTGETRTIDVHIGTLRMKLGECADMIRTVRGVGYRLEA